MSPAASQSKSKVSKQEVRKIMAQSFDKRFAMLNPSQRQAVETIDGPLMVVAGPGTGKTQVLSMRTANILKKTQMKPQNILCLTFSKSGAIAMRNRLREIIGADAYGVTVNTIHGFCNDVIVANPTVFENWSSLSQITDIERYRELNKIIDQKVPHSKLINPKMPYSQTKNILDRISELKREGRVGESELCKVADEYDRVQAEKSKEGTKAHAKNVLQAEKFREFLEIFFEYQTMLKETGRYDYEDMILNVIHALKEEEWLLASLQVRYQYILVDEFQDTNGAQYEFLSLLTEDPTGENSPNFFVVGDDDQAIYRFQGANLQNILSFRERFQGAPIVTLTESYRCTQPILNAAGSLIEHNTERLVTEISGLDKTLISHATEQGSDPEILFTPSDTAEPWVLADLIEERIKEGLSPSEIAVLVQTNRELIPLYDTLQARGIPVELTGKLDLLQHPLVEEVIAILFAVLDPHSSAHMASALSSSCFGCHPADIAELYKIRRDNELSLLDTLLDIESSKKADFSVLRKKDVVLRARDVILDLHNKLTQRTVLQTLQSLYEECNLLSEMKEGSMDAIDFAVLQEFFDRVSMRSHEQVHFTFHEFLSDIEYCRSPDFPDVKMTYDLPHLTENGVKLMTAHKSKGLEFHTVIIPNFREGHWDSRRIPPRLSIPEDLLFGWEKDVKSYEKNQDERRVAFVAFTRAKRELILMCPRSISTGDTLKDSAPSQFVSEATIQKEDSREVRDTSQASTLLLSPQREFDQEFAAFLKKRLENFALSATSVSHFLEDPQVFLEIDLLQRPQAKEAFFSYGNAIHHALAKWALSVQSGQAIDKAKMIDIFDRHMHEKEVLTEKDRKTFLTLGRHSLERYIDTVLGTSTPHIHKIEFAINAQIDEVPVKGKIDRIDLYDEHSSSASILDYKTGKPKTPAQIEEYGYKRQLIFYALLLEKGYTFVEPKDFILEFIGEREENPARRIFEVTQEEKKELSQLVKDIWEKVTNLDFTPL